MKPQKISKICGSFWDRFLVAMEIDYCNFDSNSFYALSQRGRSKRKSNLWYLPFFINKCLNRWRACQNAFFNERPLWITPKTIFNDLPPLIDAHKVIKTTKMVDGAFQLVKRPKYHPIKTLSFITHQIFFFFLPYQMTSVSKFNVDSFFVSLSKWIFEFI